MKKVFLSLIILALLVGAGYWVYRSFTVVSSLPMGAQNQGTRTGIQTAALPNAPKPDFSLNIAVNDSVFDYWYNSKKNEVYYLLENGDFYKLTNNTSQKISSSAFSNLHNVQASPDGSGAIIIFGYPFQTTFVVYNTETKTFAPLPEKTISAAWSPSSKEVVYLQEEQAASNLSIFSLDTNKTRKVTSLNILDADLNWSTTNEVYLINKPSAIDLDSMWKLDLVSKNLTPIITSEPGLLINWAKDGQTALKFTNSALNRNNGNNFVLINKNNQVEYDFKNSGKITLPSKCVFSSDKIYCAIPKNILSAWTLPDDYLKKKIYTDDDFYQITSSVGGSLFLKKINLTTEKDLLIDAQNLELVGNNLYFLNRYDNKIYSLSIK